MVICRGNVAGSTERNSSGTSKTCAWSVVFSITCTRPVNEKTPLTTDSEPRASFAPLGATPTPISTLKKPAKPGISPGARLP